MCARACVRACVRAWVGARAPVDVDSSPFNKKEWLTHTRPLCSLTETEFSLLFNRQDEKHSFIFGVIWNHLFVDIYSMPNWLTIMHSDKTTIFPNPATITISKSQKYTCLQIPPLSINSHSQGSVFVMFSHNFIVYWFVTNYYSFYCCASVCVCEFVWCILEHYDDFLMGGFGEVRICDACII